MHILLQSPPEIAADIADRVRQLRLRQNWSQEELARRAGMSVATYRLFERTGNISLERLLRLGATLHAQGDFLNLFQVPVPETMADLERTVRARSRRRARRVLPGAK